MAVLSTLVHTTSLAYAIQSAFAIPAIFYRTERYYDLSGGLTFLACTSYALALPALREGGVPALKTAVRAVLTPGLRASPWNWRQLAAGAAISLWSLRLSSYLFARIRAQGHDSRFDKLKTQPARFAGAWFFQALWVSLSVLPLTTLASVPATAFPTAAVLTATDVLGLGLWSAGFAIEILADRQKNAWLAARRRKEHDEEFLSKGWWALCRYPNYFGELTLWTGLATFAGGVLLREPVGTALGLVGPLAKVVVPLVPFLSPAFSAFLLLKVSGVPLSERKYDEKFGDRDDYKRWRENTPLIFPKLWK